MSVMMIQSGRFGAAAPFTPLDLSPALWVDPSDASTVTISGSSGAYIGANGLVLPGTGVNNATSPSPSPSITDDVDVIAYCTPTSWTPGAINAIANRSAVSAGWSFYLNTSGTLGFTIPSVADYASTVATGLSGSKWVRVTRVRSSGIITFYTSTDGSSWTQLGSTVAGSTAAMPSTTNPTLVGITTSNTLPFNGTIHRVIVKNGVAGTTVFDADFENTTPFVSAFTESALGAPVYVVSSTATSATANYSYIGPEGFVCGGSGTFTYGAKTTSYAALGVTDLDVIVKAQLPNWAPTGTGGDWAFVLRGSGIAGFVAQLADASGSGKLRLVWKEGGSTRVAISTVATGLAAGTTNWIRYTLDIDNGASGYDVNFYTSPDGVTWTQLGSTVTAAGVTSINNTGDLAVGVDRVVGTVKRAIIKNGIGGTVVYDADFEAAPDYAASFTESSSNAATVTITATNTPANAAGALVSQIDDKSGNARHLTQGTAANMPKYWNGRNGNNCLVFDGTNDQLNGGDILDLGTNSLTHYTIASPASAANMTMYGKYKVTPQAGMWLSVIQTSPSPTAFEGSYIDATTTTRTSRSGAVVAGDVVVHGSITDRAAGTVVERRNGVDGPTTASFTPDTATNHNVATHFYVGALRNSADSAFQAGYWFGGSMGDIIVCLEALGTTDRDNLEDYLMAKAGVA